ncbi:MAG: outer membrane lipoprotein carrier protein LolA [Desulfovibrionaceae bacterium]|nr:outer membrane lipoprotein carrier protein LolA [Desulfovibrionaceae bacterium]
MRFLLSLVFWGICASASAAESVEALLAQAAQGLGKTTTLEAQFLQRTTFAFMDIALESSGKLCFSLQNRRQPMIFWEYRAPDVSGFRYAGGEAELWLGTSAHQASSAEKQMLTGMTEQILQWVSFDTAQLKSRYQILPGSSDHSLKFVPAQESQLFASIELTFSDDYERIAELCFTGKNDDVTRIIFNVQSINTALSDDCKQ